MMVHALKVQAEIHREAEIRRDAEIRREAEFQVTQQELEGINLTQTEPDFTRGINIEDPEEDSLEELDPELLAGIIPQIDEEQNIPPSPPERGGDVILVLPTPMPRVANVSPVVKACCAPKKKHRYKGRP